jgi:hypothetical protein
MKYHGTDLCLYISCVILSNLSSDLHDLEEFTKRYGIHGLRLPLQLALAVSPCTLFLDTCLHKRALDRFALLRVCLPCFLSECVCSCLTTRFGKD